MIVDSITRISKVCLVLKEGVVPPVVEVRH